MTLSREAPAGLRDPESSSSATPVRAQLLATEHWSLLAARGMTWSEVMSRIAVHLTISSAALVVLALVTQATGFGVAFHVLSIGLTSAILALGTLTGVRVHNASREDAAIILGMNRLRAGYVKMDPGIAEYLVTSRYDDQAGLMATYTMGMRRSTLSHVMGSTSMFINIVNAIVAGTLGALIADAASGDLVATSLGGIVAGAAYLAMTVEVARRSFAQPPLDARFPTPATRSWRLTWLRRGSDPSARSMTPPVRGLRWTPSPAAPPQQATVPTHGTRADMLISAWRAPPPSLRTHFDAREVRQPV